MPVAFWGLWRILINLLAAVPTAIYAARKTDFRLVFICGLLNGFGVAVGLWISLGRIPQGTAMPRWNFAGFPVDFVLIPGAEVIVPGIVGGIVGASSRWWKSLGKNEAQ